MKRKDFIRNSSGILLGSVFLTMLLSIIKDITY